MNHSLVTIITPCYNGEAFLDGYFRSILAQTYDHLELIFVNDGSTDRTEEIALSYRAALEERGIVYKYLYQANGGQAKAMNTGFRELTGEYLVWPDSDDLMTPDSVEKRARFLDTHAEYALVRSNGYHFDYRTGKPLFRVSDQDNRFDEDIFLDLIQENTFCCCGCYMVRVNALREIYPDLRIYESPAGQNWQILIPLAGRHRCGYVDEDLYQVMQREGSHSRQKRTKEQTVERFLELKRVLEDGIALSGRTDRDYASIVSIKYMKILFRVYMRFGDLENGKKYYDLLCENAVLEPYEKQLFLKTAHPYRYRLWEILGRCRRAAGKLRAAFRIGNR